MAGFYTELKGDAIMFGGMSCKNNDQPLTNFDSTSAIFKPYIWLYKTVNFREGIWALGEGGYPRAHPPV